MIDVDPSVRATQRRCNAELARMTHPDPRTPEGLAEIRARPPEPADLVLTPVDLGHARMFVPDHPVGLVVRVHGGGFAVGTPAHDDRLNDRIARACRAVVVSPAYRLAPDVTLREEISDCVAAVRWAAARWPELPLVLAGTSAGAHLALSAAIRLRSEVPLAGMHLDCGRYDLAGTASARAATEETLLLTRTWLDAFAELALPGVIGDALRDPAFSPLYEDLRGLPPALLTVGALDPLLDDSRLLAERLPDAELQIWPEAPHSFLSSGTPLAELAFTRVLDWIAARF
ncbi:MAG: alpha/beta hydrolase fold domain-containing protein [Solirubrobacteraceae bacterium]|nr:alpha/beta hydrolase fold domain-containing protein [Solirubrobacteraceae bacterium]